MKWVVVLLIMMNLGVWYLSDERAGGSVSPSAGAGSLPRVASLKTETPVNSGKTEFVQNDFGQSAADVSGGLVCVRLGWLPSREEAKELVAPIEMDVDIRIDEEQRALPPLHWVIIPPQPDAVAQSQFRSIQRQGIDSYLVTEGENRNAISLGLFESREAAISVLEEKKRQNLNVVLANFPRNQISYALVFEAEPKLAKSTVQAVETGYGKNFDFIEINPCKSVATP